MAGEIRTDAHAFRARSLVEVRSTADRKRGSRVDIRAYRAILIDCFWGVVFVTGSDTGTQEIPLLANRFRVLRSIGEGGASEVFLVEDTRNQGKKVALKILRDEDVFDEHTRRRFWDEMTTCKALSHPNLIESYDFLELSGRFAFTMEYVEGRDLLSILGKRPLRNEDLDMIFEQVLSALAELHANGIVHRDIKLENILLRNDGQVKLSDLGLMKRLGTQGYTKPGLLLGTAQYMPPEYIKASIYDGRGDLYALGVVLLELLTGKRRLSDKPGNQILDHLMRTGFQVPDYVLEGLPKKYVTILRRALQVQPEKRYQNAQEMLADFRKPMDSFFSSPQADITVGVTWSQLIRNRVRPSRLSEMWPVFVRRTAAVVVGAVAVLGALSYLLR